MNIILFSGLYIDLFLYRIEKCKDNRSNFRIFYRLLIASCGSILLKVVAFRYIGATKPTLKIDKSVSSGIFAACPAHV